MEPVAELTSDGFLRPIQPNKLRIGSPENYLNDVITANITMASCSGDKEVLGDIDAEFEKIKLPKPVKYVRKIGKGGEEIGFIAEEMPEILRRENGYDLRALVTYLAWKIAKIEKEIKNKK